MNQFNIIHIIISVSIVFIGYMILWSSPDHPGSWKTAKKLRRLAFHFSLWFIALLQVGMFSFGLGAFLFQSPLYYFAIAALVIAIIGSIAVVEILGVVIRSSAYWSDKKRVSLITIYALSSFTFSIAVAFLCESKISAMNQQGVREGP